MPTSTFSWTPNIGATSQIFQYKRTVDLIWSSPITLSGTTNSQIVYSLLSGTSYDFRVMANCGVGPSSWATYTSTSPCYAPTSVKYTGTLINATNIGSQITCSVNSNTWNTSDGILFPEITMSGGYITGVFNIDGTAVSGYATTALTSSPLWKNFPITSINGRMNSQAISAGSTPTVVNGFIGFEYTYYAKTNHLIYIGIGTNAYGKIILNGTTILNQTSASYDNGASWKIYPVWVNIGPNFLYLGATKPPSVTIGAGNGCSFGIEIYESSSAQILSATTISDLNVIFSTLTLAGTNLTVGDNYGYSCSLSDYYLDMSIPAIGSYYQCVKKIG